MTYTYTRPEPKTRTIKPAIVVLAAIVLAIVTFNIMGPKSKPAPLATQPMSFGAPVEQDEAKASIKIPEALTYRGIDNAIRDFQMDNAQAGHKLKLAMKSDSNPVRRAFIYADRKFSLMAILVGFAFLFTLISFGFIRTSKDADLSNY